MAFDKSYSGDSQTLAIITQTIQAKTAVVPGVTVKAELAGLVNAEVASFYYDLAPMLPLAMPVVISMLQVLETKKHH